MPTTYSGKTKIKLCERLGKSWKALADYFEIPAHERDDFEKGEACGEIWEWLNARNRLGELEEALEFIGREDLVRDILETVAPPTPPQQPWQKKPPYPGLRPFAPDEAPIFFGRHQEIQELLARLADPANRFIAVVGASGSGKSSLVAAGLIPRLHEIAGGKDWPWLRFTPGGLGNDPFLALAARLEPLLEKRGLSGNDIANKLRSTGDLSEVAGFILEDNGAAELLLFIDQFEELFTLTAPEHQRRFIAMLAKAVEVPRLRILLTLRADFYHRCVEDARLARLLRLGSYPLAAPGIRELLEMITGPAALAGLKFEEGLPGRILEDTGGEPGALALMAFALAELYKARSPDGTLTHAAYEGFEGVHGAIGRRADEAYTSLKPAVQGKLGEVFRDLVEVNERGIATRRRAPLRTLTGSTEAEQLVTALSDARLLVKGRGEDNEPIVEVAHEALFRSWPRLREWIEHTADDHRLRRQITQAAAEWQARDCKDMYRWPDERVVEIIAMLDRLGLRLEDLSDIEQDFLGPLDRERMLAELNEPTTSHEQRTTIGVRLALLGDPRPGVGLRKDGLPDIVWCEVPGGKIALEDVAGTFPVKPFHIAKYPLTWLQYRSFLEADDGFENPRWWGESLWFQFQVEKPGRQFNRRANHPAENLCWLEAVAFCRWLSARLGYEIRLPTEWEWQQAATGGDPANEYPWGPDWDSNRANTDESELNRSTAVGMYPLGASPVGALDMAGNVWEWCLNEYDDPKRTDLSGDARRVVRGGSWNYGQFYARAAFRNHYHPGYRYNFLGVRVVCSSPILS